MSYNGYGDKLDACFFSFWWGAEQCLSAYEALLRIVVIHQGPVNMYVNLSTQPFEVLDQVAQQANTISPNG
jgi:hypothetical protein